MIKRGELYYADLSPVVGSEQGGVRPVLIVQNDVGNKYSPTIIAAAITPIAVSPVPGCGWKPVIAVAELSSTIISILE